MAKIKKGKFIVIEGIDGSGKSVQTQKLIERLKRKGEQVLAGDFPRYYNSEWGKLVGRFLKGEFGGIKEVSPYLAVLPYMLDQYTWSRDVARPWMQKGGWIVSNRYFTSNVHQVAKQNGVAKTKYRQWLWPIGYEHLGIMKPDLVIFLDVPQKVSQKLNTRKSDRKYLGRRKKDIAEKDYSHQEKAYKEYLKMVKETPGWKSVSCVDKRGLLTVDEIHEKVWETIWQKK